MVCDRCHMGRDGARGGMTDGSPASDTAVLEAPPIDPAILGSTRLSALDEAAARELLADARTYEVSTGEHILAATDWPARVGVLLEGSVRWYLTAADGRQLTVRYGRAGELISRRSDAPREVSPLRIQAITSCRVLEFDPDALLRAMSSIPAVAMAFVNDFSLRLQDVYSTVADTAFGTMRQRVARHLIALAEAHGPTFGRPRAIVTQQQLADGTGSSREAVARTLAVLRDEEVIRT